VVKILGRAQSSISAVPSLMVTHTNNVMTYHEALEGTFEITVSLSMHNMNVRCSGKTFIHYQYTILN
jgi:hypothetical protein